MMTPEQIRENLNEQLRLTSDIAELEKDGKLDSYEERRKLETQRSALAFALGCETDPVAERDAGRRANESIVKANESAVAIREVQVRDSESAIAWRADMVAHVNRMEQIFADGMAKIAAAIAGTK